MILKVCQKQIGSKLIFYHSYVICFFQTKSFFRVIASGKTSATTGILTSAPQDSVYYKVFKNNMNEDSYSSKFGNSVKRMLSEPQTTLFTQEVKAVITKEYSNCLVSIIFFKAAKVLKNFLHIRLKRSG